MQYPKMILILKIKSWVYQFIVQHGCKAIERIYLPVFNVEVIAVFNGSWTNYRSYRAIIYRVRGPASMIKDADFIVQVLTLQNLLLAMRKFNR